MELTEFCTMKRTSLTLLASAALLLVPCLSPARPVRAVLVVQNHAGDEFSKPLSNIGSRLRAALAGKRFAVIDPNDRVGTEQNRGPNGEPLPPSSAVNLALASEGELLLTASIDEASVDTIGMPGSRQRQFAQMTLTLAAVQLPLGETVISETFTAKSDSVPTEMLSARADVLYNQAVQRLVAGAAKKFLAACEAADDWANVTVPDYVTVGFGCNLPGANVLLDGLSRGTAGGPGTSVLKVHTWRGIHHVRIESDFMRPFETEALLEDGTSFLTVLKESDEGRRLRREDRHFDLLMNRIEKSGATDDDVRILKAEGYGKYLAASYTRIEGMPQILNAHDFNPDFGLGSAADDDTGESTDAYIRELGASIGFPVASPEETTEHTDNTEGRDGSPSRPQDGAVSPSEPPDDDEESAVSAAASSSASASVNAPRPFPDEQMVVATAPTATAAGGASGSPAVASATASSGATVADALDTLNSGASIAKSILHIWNMVH